MYNCLQQYLNEQNNRYAKHLPYRIGHSIEKAMHSCLKKFTILLRIANILPMCILAFLKLLTAWKLSKYRGFSDPYLDTFHAVFNQSILLKNLELQRITDRNYEPIALHEH